jgi:hypothetical protein
VVLAEPEPEPEAEAPSPDWPLNSWGVGWIKFNRELMAAGKTNRDYAIETIAYSQKANAAEAKRAADWLQTLAERGAAARNAPGGYVREHEDDFCPTCMQPADRVALERQVLMLFSDDGKTFNPTERDSKCSYGKLTERLENTGNAVAVAKLWRLLGLAMADTIADAEPTSEQLVAAAKEQLSFLDGPRTATMTTPGEIIQLFQPFPDNCAGCAAGRTANRRAAGVAYRTRRRAQVGDRDGPCAE